MGRDNYSLEQHLFVGPRSGGDYIRVGIFAGIHGDEHAGVYAAVRFLQDGDKVKAALRFKGRQMAHRELGYKIINRLIVDIGENGIVEFMPRMEGNTLHAIIAPGKKEQQPKKPAAPRQPEAPAPQAQTAQ